MKIKKISKKVKSIGLDTKNAAKYIGVSDSLLNKYRQTGEGPQYCKVGKKVIYLTKDLKRYIKSKRV